MTASTEENRFRFWDSCFTLLTAATVENTCGFLDNSFRSVDSCYSGKQIKFPDEAASVPLTATTLNIRFSL